MATRQAIAKEGGQRAAAPGLYLDGSKSVLVILTGHRVIFSLIQASPLPPVDTDYDIQNSYNRWPLIHEINPKKKIS